jgi:glutamate 5-kinase
MSALAATHDPSIQMIDTSIVRVHQHAACLARNKGQSMGRSRGGLSCKIHAVVDAKGLPVQLALTAGEAHDNRLASKLLSRLKSGTMLLADEGMTPTGSEPLSLRKAHGPTFRRSAIAITQSASARIFTAPATLLSGSSTRSNSVEESLLVTTSSPPTTSRSSSSHQ